MKRPLSAVAVDTTVAYKKVKLAPLGPGENKVSLPRRTDWVIALAAPKP